MEAEHNKPIPTENKKPRKGPPDFKDVLADNHPKEPEELIQEGHSPEQSDSGPEHPIDLIPDQHRQGLFVKEPALPVEAIPEGPKPEQSDSGPEHPIGLIPEQLKQGL